MRLSNLLIVSCAVWVLSGCDAIYGLLQKEGAEEKELIGEVVPFESNIRVEEVQKLLKLYGYKAGKADGVLGVNTRNAIAAFQEDNNLEVTRFVDKVTWERLNYFEPFGLVVAGELNVKAVQGALTEAGFRPGKIDGNLGPRTIDAIKRFQRSKGLKGDGKVGLRTLIKLTDYIPLQP